MDATTLTKLIEKRLDILSLPKETRDIVIVRLGENILKRTNLTILETVKEDDMEEVTEMIEKGKLANLLTFLSEKYPELDEKIIAISNDVVSEFLEA
jgi:hypothetical protein